ncbi:MAG: hypothetical protein LBU89_00795 [Fibromonadaceae bacterium]|jgi:hypothetical protein|nr:hypothetical protein [Fibromonadaceae bacterium]
MIKIPKNEAGDFVDNEDIVAFCHDHLIGWGIANSWAVGMEEKKWKVSCGAPIYKHWKALLHAYAVGEKARRLLKHFGGNYKKSILMSDLLKFHIENPKSADSNPIAKFLINELFHKYFIKPLSEEIKQEGV